MVYFVEEIFFGKFQIIFVEFNFPRNLKIKFRKNNFLPKGILKFYEKYLTDSFYFDYRSSFTKYIDPDP
jgi:hypothetical protein